MSANRIDSLSWAGITSLYCRPTPGRPPLFQPRVIYLPAIVYVGARKRCYVLFCHPLTSICSHFFSVSSPGHLEILKALLSTPVENVSTDIAKVTMRRIPYWETLDAQTSNNDLSGIIEYQRTITRFGDFSAFMDLQLLLRFDTCKLST